MRECNGHEQLGAPREGERARGPGRIRSVGAVVNRFHQHRGAEDADGLTVFYCHYGVLGRQNFSVCSLVQSV